MQGQTPSAGQVTRSSEGGITSGSPPCPSPLPIGPESVPVAPGYLLPHHPSCGPHCGRRLGAGPSQVPPPCADAQSHTSCSLEPWYPSSRVSGLQRTGAPTTLQSGKRGALQGPEASYQPSRWPSRPRVSLSNGPKEFGNPGPPGRKQIPPTRPSTSQWIWPSGIARSKPIAPQEAGLLQVRE